MKEKVCRKSSAPFSSKKIFVRKNTSDHLSMFVNKYLINKSLIILWQSIKSCKTNVICNLPFCPYLSSLIILPTDVVCHWLLRKLELIEIKYANYAKDSKMLGLFSGYESREYILFYSTIHILLYIFSTIHYTYSTIHWEEKVIRTKIIVIFSLCAFP